MNAPFQSVRHALTWYALVRREGLPIPLRAYQAKPRVCESPKHDLDLRLAEPAVLVKKIATLLDLLNDGEKALLLEAETNIADRGVRQRRYKKRHELRRFLTPYFIKEGLVESECEEGEA